MKMKNYLLFIGILALSILALSIVADESEARTCVWDGEAESPLASIAENWDLDICPVPLDDILFDGLHLVNASADDPCIWDLDNDSFGTFTIAGEYSGIITQSSDMYISGYYQAGGTFTGVLTKTVYLNGNFLKTAGTVTSNKIVLDIIGNGEFSTNEVSSAYNTIKFHAKTNVKTNVGLVHLYVYDNLNIDSGKIVESWSGVLKTVYNEGIINGSGTLKITINSAYGIVFTPGQVDCLLNINVHSASTGSQTIPLSGSLSGSSLLTVISNRAPHTCTLDLNGHNLTASSITVGTRGILQCGEGTITTGELTSTAGTITEETATWVFTDGAIVTCAEGQKLYDVYMRGECDFVNSVNVTNELMFVDVPSVYGDLDLYLDDVYSKTVSKEFNLYGNTGAFEYSYLPDIQITISQYYTDIDFSIYAYISTNLPCSYNITGVASPWLSYHEGRIVGMPPDIGNYSYTITATHESGSVDIVNGYILIGTLSTPEYNFDVIWGLLLWIVITFFMLLGYFKEIPILMITTWVISFGNIVMSLSIPNFTPFVVLFALGNTIIFFIGMYRWRG